MPLNTDNMMNNEVFLDEVILSFCKKTPEAIAIKYNGKETNYRELGQKVEALSQQLLVNGVKAGDFVSVLLPPSENITIALLAIIRVGAIYAPLDFEHPDKQLADRYSDIDVKLTVTCRRYSTRVNTLTSNLLLVEDIALPDSDRLPLPKRDLSSPSCIFFTSGTSGKAKGVLGSAIAMRDSIIYPAQDLNFTHADTLNSIARYAWSISMLELLAPLVVGGTSLIMERHLALDLSWLKKQISQCTTFHCPPALLRNFANFIEENYSTDDYPSQLRLVWYGGDTFLPEHIDTLHRAFPNAEIGTAYGCTEIFGLSHIHLYERQNKINKVLIGTPSTGMEQLLCDDRGKLVPPGQEGELLLGGSRITLEYWNNPSLNAERFTQIDNQRFFRTGDYASQTPSGALEFLLRKDSQVKIRGIRIELGEVEYHLSQFEEIREAIVLAVESASKDFELRAYLVGHKSLDIQEIQQEISKQLPDYMVPAKWHVIDSLPVTENFKIDRKALAALKEKNTSSFTGAEQTLAAIWELVIGQAPQSNTDDFFSIGGNSLLVMQLAQEISKQLDTPVEVADIYRNPTLISQVSLLKIESPSLNTNSENNELFATQGQVGLFFRELFEGNGESITCTRYVSSKKPYIDSIIRKAIIMLMERFPTLKTNIEVKRQNVLLLEKSYVEDQIEVIRKPKGLSLAPNAQNPLKKHAHKFNLKNSPLVCAIISPMQDGSEILQLTAHHIASDDNAMGRVARDFITIYDSLLKQESPKLLNNLLDYNSYAKEQFDKVSSGSFDSRAQEIAEQLNEMLSICQENPAFDLSTWNKKDSAVFVNNELSQVAENASFIDFVAALSWSLNKLNGREKFVFCAHIALRRDSEATPIVGMFINLIPIITGVNPEHSFIEHKQRTSTDFNKALSNSDVPYEQVLKAHDNLKKLKKFPFDAFVNELNFSDTYEDGYKNMIVPTRFATNGNEVNMTIMQANDKKVVQLESPTIDNIHQYLSELTSEILSTIDNP